MNKYKKLAFNTVIFAIGTFGSKILVILLTRLYTKYIDPSGMGQKDLLETAALFLQPVFTFALQEYLIRFGLDKKYDKKAVFTTSAVITFVGMLVMSLIVPGLRFVSALNFIRGYSTLLTLYVCISSLRMLCTQFVRARDMVQLFALDGILATLSLLVFNLIFIAGFKMGVKGFMISVILSDLCSSVFLIVLGDLRSFFRMKNFSGPLAKEMMSYSLPLIPTIVMWTITGLSDRLFIKNMRSSRVELGMTQVGLYGVANRIPNLISMVSTIFFQAWNMSAITENDSADRNRFYQRVYSAYEAILFIASAGLLLFIKPVTAIITNTNTYPEYKTVYLFTPILVASVVFMSLNQFLGGIYTATRHTKNSFWTSLAACSINLVMNYFLIPSWGIQGAAVATFLSYFFCFWARIIDARYYVPFKYKGGRTLANTALIFMMTWVTIGKFSMPYLWLFTLFVMIMALNLRPMMTTVKKITKK